MEIISDKAPVQFTASAIAEILRLMEEKGMDKEQFLRIGVQGGGCSGLTYIMAFDDKKDNDESFDCEGIPCIIDRGQTMYLHGMEIDWQIGLENRGFIFVNPNASATCGCGTSFAV